MASDDFELVVDGKDFKSGSEVNVDVPNLVTVAGVAISQIIDALGNLKEKNSVLNRHEIKVLQFSDSEAVKAKGFFSIFGGQLDKVSSGVIQEAKKFAIVKDKESGRSYEFGVAVRLYAAYQEMGAEVKASLPEMAAQASLSNGRAAISIAVDGYKGNIGDLLPTPGELNVESYSSYLNAFDEIRNRVLGRDGESYHAPTLLGWLKDEETSPKMLART
ncbi:MAG: hypothetical protein MRY77_02280 [Rhodobacteraceae bacterium]|nr:hypothetical protein [Paracoccaceae bacterium]